MCTAITHTAKERGHSQLSFNVLVIKIESQTTEKMGFQFVHVYAVNVRVHMSSRYSYSSIVICHMHIQNIHICTDI